MIRRGLEAGSGLSAQGLQQMRAFAGDVIARAGEGPDEDARVVAIAAVFQEFGYTREATQLLLDKAKQAQYGAQTGALQTALLVFNLRSNAQMAEALLQRGVLLHFDRAEVAHECERAGMLQRAYELSD